MSNSVHFKYLFSNANDQLSESYKDGLCNVLRLVGVDQVILSTITKFKNDNICLITAYDGDEIVGGIRLELKSKETPHILPVEKSQNQYQTRIIEKVNRLIQNDYSIAEVCGLWANPSKRGLGLGAKLALEATELACDMGVHILVSLLPRHTLGYFQRLSYLPDPEIPPMAYPDDRYISTLVWMHNASHLKSAPQQYFKSQFEIQNFI